MRQAAVLKKPCVSKIYTGAGAYGRPKEPRRMDERKPGGVGYRFSCVENHAGTCGIPAAKDAALF